MRARCLYTKVKESQEEANFIRLIQKIPSLKIPIAILGLALLSMIGVSIYPIFSHTFSYVWIEFLFLAVEIYLLYVIIPNRIQDYYAGVMDYDWHAYKKVYIAGRYQLFKESLDTMNIDTLEEIYEYISKEKDFPRETIWDYKFFTTSVTFLLIGWGGIVKVLAGDKPELLYLSVGAVLFLIIVIPLFRPINTENDKLRELIQFLSWYECDMDDKGKGE